MTNATLKTSLHALHHEYGARCIDFASFELPAWFSSMKEEHLAVRHTVGMFDISHMGLFRISGPSSRAFLQSLSCNTTPSPSSSKMVYSMFLNENGMILDDVMFGCIDDTWHLVVNGANQHKIKGWLAHHAPDDMVIEHLNQSHSFIAVQGPDAEAACQSVVDIPLSTLNRFELTTTSFGNFPCVISRTGYTGEDGFEIMIAHDGAIELWSHLYKEGVTPCGLAARDTLRIEYGLPLYGQELSESIHPHMTRYAWVVKNTHSFIGQEALVRHKDAVQVTSVGLQLSEPLIARPNYLIEEGGYISSGTLSPHSGNSIALAFVPVDYASIGSTVSVHIRKKLISATVTDVPFSGIR